jgi:hypothetical protein
MAFSRAGNRCIFRTALQAAEKKQNRRHSEERSDEESALSAGTTNKAFFRSFVRARFQPCRQAAREKRLYRLRKKA